MTDRPLPIKIIQFGKGNFLRGFTVWMIDHLNKTKDFNAGIQIVETFRTPKSEQLINQGFKYHVVEQGLENDDVVERTSSIDAITGLTNVVEQFDEFLELALQPELQFIISNTTEAGIVFKHDDTDISTPLTFPSRLTALLFHRYKELGNHTQKIYVLPCELIDNNADILRNCIGNYCDLWQLPKEFTQWLDNYVYFCNTLVDRIVSGYPEQIDTYKDRLSFNDKLLVVCEPYHLWAIEDKADLSHCIPVNKTGLNICFVNDIKPYKDIKVRILNAAHTAMVSMGMVYGIKTVDEFMSNTVYRKFIDNMLSNEVIQTLTHSKKEASAFKNSVFDRFQNPFIKHQLSAIQLNSISKFRTRLLPSLKEFVVVNATIPQYISEVLAHLLWLYKDSKAPSGFILKDRSTVFEIFKNAWAQNDFGKTAQILLESEELWGENLNLIQGLHRAVTDSLMSIANRLKMVNTL